MENIEKKLYWEKIYRTKKMDEVGWYQPVPVTSLKFIDELNLPLDTPIIDIGGGDSYLVDHLLKKGFTDITVLDIAESAILRAKNRLGSNAENVTWIVADASGFFSKRKYGLWHDRAAFHFLTSQEEIDNYLENASKNIAREGHLIIGTFSDSGPEKCSGLEIRQYSKNALSDLFGKFFKKIKCVNLDHKTPLGSLQNYTFCSFAKSVN